MTKSKERNDIMPKQNFTPEQRAEYRQKQAAEIKAMSEDIERGIKEVFESDRYKDYLKFMSKFTNYSLNNTILIAMQKPDASLVAAFGKWKDMGRTVNKGAKGIGIFAPIKVNSNAHIETEVPVTDKFGNKVYNDDGTEKTETVSEPIKELHFKKVYVFDVSQTTGKEIPTLVDELEGDIDDARMNAIMRGVRNAAGVPVDFEKITSGAKGYYSFDEKRIAINEGMSDFQTLKTAFHETAHRLLHDPDSELDTKELGKNEREVQAESVAYIVASRYGIDTSEYTFPYVASWSADKELKELKNHLTEIQKTAKKICDSIDNELLKLKKRDLSLDELEKDTELNNVQKAELIIDKLTDTDVSIDQEVVSDILTKAADSKDFKLIAKEINKAAANEKKRRDLNSKINGKFTDDKAEITEAFENGEEVYSVDNNSEQLISSKAEIENTEGLFAVAAVPAVYDPVPKPSAPVGEKKTFPVPTKVIDKLTAELEAAKIAYTSSKGQKYGTITISATDIDRYKECTAKVKAELNGEERTAEKREKYGFGDKKQHTISEPVTHRFNAHAAKLIADELTALGVHFSGTNGDKVTTITISKADEPHFRQAVENAKAKSQKKEINYEYAKVPLVMESYAQAKENNRLQPFYNSLNALKACDKYISENMEKAFMERKTSDFCTELEQRFGADKAMYVLGKALTDKGAVPKQFEESLKKYEFNVRTFKPLADLQPVMLKSLYNDLMERNKVIEKAPEPFKLNSYFNNKHLIPLERKTLGTDSRGLPVTKTERSSRNETYVRGHGWLNNDERDRVHKEYGQADFHTLVEKINVSYIDDNGRLGQMDITPDEYAAFSDRTYLEENKERYEAAKAKYEEMLSGAERRDKPTEYYAVSQVTENRYQIMTIGADGTTENVTNKLSKADVIKAMNELYRQHSSNADVHIVSPEELSQRSVDIYNKQTAVERDPDRLYKVYPTPLKNAKEGQSHFVQQYKRDGDRYTPISVPLVGTFEQCQEFAKKAQAAAIKPTYKIYQLTGGEDNHGYRFAGTEELAKFGMKIEFDRYAKVYEGQLDDVQKTDLPTTLNGIYEKFNLDHPADFRGHSLNVSDVVVLDTKPYFVDKIGFKALSNFTSEQRIETMQKRYMESYEKRVAEAKTPYELERIAQEGQRLGFDVSFKPNEKLHTDIEHTTIETTQTKKNRRGAI